MEIIRTYEKGSEEYGRLEKAAEILTIISPKRRRYTVGDCYFDYGQNWMWTTILYEDDMWGTAQALNPRDYERILTSDNLLAALDEVAQDKFWSDKEAC